jgi:hypothetical protein
MNNDTYLKRKEYHRNYGREWMRKRRREFFEGKACVQCGAAERLELDHIDPSQKTSHKVWSWRKERREAELAKCQVLCVLCHKKKTFPGYSGLKHGTAHGYTHYGCLCKLCLVAHNAACKSWYERRGRALRAARRTARKAAKRAEKATELGLTVLHLPH